MTITFPKRQANVAALRPAAFNAWVERFPTDAPSDLVGAITGAAKTYATLFETHERIAGDRTLTDGARLVRQARSARKLATDALERIAKAREGVGRARDQLQTRMAKPFDFCEKHFAENMQAAEIRSYFASLGPGRVPAITRAIEAMDLTTLTALGSGPSYLSGLDDRLQSMARDAVLRVVDPEAKPAFEKLTEADKFAQSFEATIAQSTADLVDFQTAESFERVAAEAAA